MLKMLLKVVFFLTGVMAISNCLLKLALRDKQIGIIGSPDGPTAILIKDKETY